MGVKMLRAACRPSAGGTGPDAHWLPRVFSRGLLQGPPPQSVHRSPPSGLRSLPSSEACGSDFSPFLWVLCGYPYETGPVCLQGVTRGRGSDQSSWAGKRNPGRCWVHRGQAASTLSARPPLPGSTRGLQRPCQPPGRRPMGPDRTGERAGVGEDETLHDRARLGLHWGLEGEAELLKDAGSRRTAQLNKQNKTMLW